MFKDNKKLVYSIKILNSINKGCNAIELISEDIDSPRHYTAKIIAELRKKNLFDKNYNLNKKFNEITLAEIMEDDGNLPPGLAEAILSKLQTILIHNFLEV